MKTIFLTLLFMITLSVLTAGPIMLFGKFGIFIAAGVWIMVGVAASKVRR